MVYLRRKKKSTGRFDRVCAAQDESCSPEERSKVEQLPNLPILSSSSCEHQKGLPWRITCVVCGEAFVGDHNSRHTCLGVTRTSQDLGLSYRRLLYAHDLLDLPDFSDFDVDQWTDWQETDAVEVLVRHRHEIHVVGQRTALPELPEAGALGMVYCRTNDVPEDQLEGYRYTMAIDK